MEPLRSVRGVAHGHVAGFLSFIREKGVMGLAIGFIVGGAVSKLVSAFSTDIVNPLVGLIFNSAELRQASTTIASVTFKWGDFLATVIDFFIIAAVVYFGFRVLGLDKADAKKSE